MTMKTVLTGYAIFLAYVLVTKLVVAPAAVSAGIPLLRDL